MRFTILSILIFFAAQISAQNLSGIVLDRTTNKPITGARVYLPELKMASITDSLGYFEIKNIIEKSVQIVFSAEGYKTTTVQVKLADHELFTWFLEELHIKFDAVIVSTPNGDLQKNSITYVSAHPLSTLNKIPTTSLGEAITNIPGVYQSGIGNGISKPVIRGLSGARVLTYWDGLRIENQQWGGDHGMGVTGLGIGNVEIIKGPASLLYGSDALGGVVYFTDENFAKRNYFEGYVNTQFETNTLGNGTDVGLKLSKEKIRFTFYAGTQTFADYQLANKLYVQNSRYYQNTVKGAISFNNKKWISTFRYALNDGYFGLPGHTHDSLATVSSFLSSTQKRKASIPGQKVQNQYISYTNKLFLDKSELSIIVGNTNNKLREFEEKVTIPSINMNLNSSHANIYWSRKFNRKIKLLLGTASMLQFNSNAATAEEKIIPNAETIDLGAYSILNYQLQKWGFQVGVRLDNRSLKTKEPFKETPPISKTYTSSNYSIAVARLTEKAELRMNLSSGFRAPHSSELLTNGAHHGSFRYEIGNLDLKTENALQLDLSSNFHLEHFDIIINPFVNRINNYIYINPQNYAIDGLQVYTYEQVDYAFLIGGDIGVHWHPHKAHWLHLESSYSIIDGRDKDGNALPLIPPARINNLIKFDLNLPGKFQVEGIVVQHQYIFEQDRVTDFETKTPGYHLLNLSANMKLSQKTPLYISLGARNILNVAYFNHLGSLKQIGIPNPGRNFFIKLNYKFEKQIKK